MRGQGGAGADVGVLEVVDGRADHDRPGAEEISDGTRRPWRCRDAVADPAQQHDEAVALAGAERVHARGPRCAAYVVEQVGLVPSCGTVPSTTATGCCRPSPARSRATASSRRPRRGAPSRRRAPRGGRPRRRGPRRRGRRPRRWRRRPHGRSAARRRGRRGRPRGPGPRPGWDSTTSMPSRTRSTVCWRLITPASARGAAPKTWAATAVPSSPGAGPRRRTSRRSS